VSWRGYQVYVCTDEGYWPLAIWAEDIPDVLIVGKVMRNLLRDPGGQRPWLESGDTS
jgi:hypothetical protein